MTDNKTVDMRHENGSPKEKKSRNGKAVTMIPITSLRKFKEYPFEICDDEDMARLVESIMRIGVIQPLIVRECERGQYEIISGHRRWHAATLVGLSKIPVFIRELTDDEAVELMIHTNIRGR